jgi:glutamate-ammonia-ligase adenylyltransferase
VVRAGPDPEGSLHRLASLAESAPGISLAELARLAPVAGASRGLWDCLLRHPEWIRESPTAADPRHLVQSQMIEIAADDLSGQVAIDQTMERLSALADQAVELSLERTRTRLMDRHPETAEVVMAVVAMGKWGGVELNYASDIDLLFVYRAPGGDPEAHRRAALRLASGMIEDLARPTADGIAFRVDADLRPEGSTGPLVRTLESYRAYYQRWGEPWEAQALLKARSAAGDRGLGEDFLEAVGSFVWPETLSPDAIRSLRGLKARAESGAATADIKRSPGGIRDVEFSVQLLQLIHGRADQQLRLTGTLPALEALAAGGYVRSQDAADLADSYRWLRSVEHRIQLWQLAQSHLLPSDRENLARALGYRAEEAPPAQVFDTDLARHRHRVRFLHESLYYRPLLEAFASAPAHGLSREQAEDRLLALGYRDLGGAALAFEDLTAGLSRRSRLMGQLLPLMLDWLADTPHPDLGLQQLRSLMADDSTRMELVSSLQDRPLAAQRLCRLLGSSRLVGSFLDRLPEFLPRLADDRLLLELPAGEETRSTALERMQLRPDRASRMGSLRRLVRRRILRVAAADLLDLADLDRVSAALTDTADAATAAGLWAATQEVEGIPFLVVAMGKWGGRELGYGSDLDLVYVVSSPEQAGAGLKLASELGAVLGEKTPDGTAYQVDPGLRPEGRQGALARSLEAFRAYYQDRAQPWERLALIKARPVAGPPDLAAAFQELAHQHAYPAQVSPEEIRSIRHIKARVERERVPAGEDPDFHLKLGPGGLSDIEFLAQLWQLRLGHHQPELRQTSTIPALTALAAAGILTESEVGDLEEAYRLCSRIRNRLVLAAGRPLDSLPVDHEESARLARSLGFDNRAELREEYRRVTRRARRIFERRFYSDQG